MKRILISVFMLLLMLTSITSAQSCQEWNSTTYYAPGEQVIHEGKAYKALVTIWHWPPPHPIYWERVPLVECYAPEEFILMLTIFGPGGTVTVDPVPEGGQGVFDYMSQQAGRIKLEYDEPTQVTLTAQNSEGGKFLRWTGYIGDDEFESYDPVIDNVTVSGGLLRFYCDFLELQKNTVTIHFSDFGSVTVDTLPDGTVGTFDQSDGRSIQFEYYEESEITLTANPDSSVPGSYYELINWGDTNNLITNPLSIKINPPGEIHEYHPTYDISNEEFKAPAQCDVGDHIKVFGRTRCYGKIQMGEGLEESGSFLIRGKTGSDVYRINHDHIAFGNTYVWGENIFSPTVDGDVVEADSLKASGTVRAEEIVTERLCVNIESFPDYVFNADYDLKTIDEVEGYITQNGHLPGIPSEEEVMKTPADLGTLYTKLVQKVEEMTLYIVQLHKDITELESANK